MISCRLVAESGMFCHTPWFAHAIRFIIDFDDDAPFPSVYVNTRMFSSTLSCLTSASGSSEPVFSPSVRNMIMRAPEHPVVSLVPVRLLPHDDSAMRNALRRPEPMFVPPYA